MRPQGTRGQTVQRRLTYLRQRFGALTPREIAIFEHGYAAGYKAGWVAGAKPPEKRVGDENQEVA